MMFLCFCVKNNKNNKKIGRLCYIIIYVTKQTMSIFGEPTKYIHFNNDTDLPVLIDAWISNDHGTMSTLVTTRIAPFESKLLYSSVGEWHMNAMFYDDTDKAVWKERGLLLAYQVKPAKALLFGGLVMSECLMTIMSAHYSHQYSQDGCAGLFCAG